MLVVNGFMNTNCNANDKHVGVDCYIVECQAGTFSGAMCPKCFLAHVKLRSKKSEAKSDAMPLFDRANSTPAVA